MITKKELFSIEEKIINDYLSLIESKNNRRKTIDYCGKSNYVLSQYLQLMCNKKRVKEIIDFLISVKNCPIETFNLKNIILKEGSFRDIYDYATLDIDPDVNDIAEAIIKKNSRETIINEKEENSTKDLERYIKEKRKSNAVYLYSFLKNVKNAPIDLLENAICEAKNAECIYYTAQDVKGVSIEKLAHSLCSLDNAMMQYIFALNIPGAPINDLAQAVIESGESLIMIRFASDVPNAPIDDLADAVGESLNPQLIYQFAREVKNAPIDELALYMILTTSVADIELFNQTIIDAPHEILNRFLEAVAAEQYTQSELLELKQKSKRL